MAKISIIVPVYKVEPYLRRCVDSVLGQTYPDFELVLVDDGSPDNCGRICEEYAQKDSRVHVIHRENGGLSAARNTGIDYVLHCGQSQWITFLDSDDWIDAHLLEYLLEGVRQYGCCISVCGHMETNGEVPAAQESPVFSQWSAEDFYLQEKVNATIAVAKLYHRDCFREMRYPVGKLHEDEYVTYRLLFVQEQIVFCDLPLYYYFQNTAGITKSRWNPRRLDLVEALQGQIAWFEEHGFHRACEQAVMGYTFNLCKHSRLCRESDLEVSEKNRYLKELAQLQKEAVSKYWPVFCRRRNLSVFAELYPVLEPCVRCLVKLRHGLKKTK